MNKNPSNTIAKNRLQNKRNPTKKPLAFRFYNNEGEAAKDKRRPSK